MSLVALWPEVIAPVLRAAAPGRLLLLGNESDAPPGIAERLFALARETGAGLTLADLPPGPAVQALHAADAAWHPIGALQAVPLAAPADAVVIDTDANWYTVYNTLQLLMARAVETRVAAPLIMLAGTEWPNARRDSYRDPGHIPQRQPYARRGIRPGRAELTDDGAFGTRNNALREGGAQNGVLTALENFLDAWPGAFTVRLMPCFGGLALLVPAARASDAVRGAVETCFAADSLRLLLARLEAERARLAAAVQQNGDALVRSGDALVRARALVARQFAGQR